MRRVAPTIIAVALLLPPASFALALSGQETVQPAPPPRTKTKRAPPPQIIPRTGKPDFSNVRRLIQQQMVARSIPTISVAVARRVEILWEEGFGRGPTERIEFPPTNTRPTTLPRSLKPLRLLR